MAQLKFQLLSLRLFKRVGDLVQHNPSASTHPAMTAIYSDWGHEPDFLAAIVISVEEEFAQVYATCKGKPAWYKMQELKVISERK